MVSEAVEGLLEFFKERPTLLRKRVANADPVLLRVLEDNGNSLTCQPIKVYSRRYECDRPYSPSGFAIEKASQAWGNAVLRKGITALAFVARYKSRSSYYEYPWRGHFEVKELSGIACAVAKWHLLDVNECGEWEPRYLRESAFLPDVLRPQEVALPFDLLERHLCEELALLAQA
jgi:hypothetical protein